MTFDFEFKCFLALRKNKQTVNKLFTVCSLLFFSRGFTDPPGSVLCVSVYISHSSRLLMAVLKAQRWCRSRGCVWASTSLRSKPQENPLRLPHIDWSLMACEAALLSALALPYQMRVNMSNRALPLVTDQWNCQVIKQIWASGLWTAHSWTSNDK